MDGLDLFASVAALAVGIDTAHANKARDKPNSYIS